MFYEDNGNLMLLNEHDLADFQCRRCGSCCCWPGDIRVTTAEQDVIAAFLGLNDNAFIAQYTRLTADRRGLSLIDNEAGHCIFFIAGQGCLINAVKPEQCRQFPYVWRNPGWEDKCAGAIVLVEKKKKAVSS